MIQRIQTIYFILAILCMVLGNIFPVYINIDATTKIANLFKLHNQIVLLILSVIIIGCIGYALVLYKNRRFQLTITGITMALTLLLNILIAVSYLPMAKEYDVHIQIAAFFPLVALLCLLLAVRAIRKDEHLVRSADRLR